MEIQVQLTREVIPAAIGVPAGVASGAGAWVEFRGRVRDEEAGQRIRALDYEAYEPMALAQTKRILEGLASEQPCLAVVAIHRVGVVPVGETALYVGVAARHRGPAFALLTAFIDRLKQDVPIWKTGALPADPASVSPPDHA